MKEELKRLHEYMQAVCKHWGSQHYLTLKVLIQNMHFDEDKIDTAMECVRQMAKVHSGDHVVQDMADQLELAVHYYTYEEQIHPHQLEDIWQIGDFDEWFSDNGYRTYNQHGEECFHITGKSAEYYSMAGVRQYFENNIVGQSKTK
jgi:hypothetical protein